ncbi:hypothetical protein ACH5RR_016385 [Cinchona calisaya]|uniref:Transposase-associated domain-containing protein n=1 Tax=Cinchona calisaya TaxID=153742 RepID=A0ABD2ZVU0_9GENT
MDRQWMYCKQRTSIEYITNVENFLEFAYKGKEEDDKIYCPGNKCNNRYFIGKHTVRGHLTINGFTDNYWVWTSHGETYAHPHTSHGNNDRSNLAIGDDMVGLVHDAFGIPNVNFTNDSGQPSEDNQSSDPNEETKDFLKLLQDAECELFPGQRCYNKSLQYQQSIKMMTLRIEKELYIKKRSKDKIMTRKRARGITMLDKLQTISETTIEEDTQRRPPTRANPNPDEEFVQPQLTKTRSGLVGSSNQSMLFTQLSVRAGLQVIGVLILYQDIAEKNAENRDHHGPPHRTGRTSFANLLEEMKNQDLDTDEFSVYLKTRTDKAGAMKDDEAVKLIASMQQQLSQILESERTLEVRQRIFKGTMGPECHGYARTIGLGPTLS